MSHWYNHKKRGIVTNFPYSERPDYDAPPDRTLRILEISLKFPAKFWKSIYVIVNYNRFLPCPSRWITRFTIRRRHRCHETSLTLSNKHNNIISIYNM
jgi:hypothetical protein